MRDLVIDTSLFKPITITINGQTYTVVRITRPVQLEMTALDKAWASGDIDVPYRRMRVLLGDHPEFDSLDIKEVNRIVEHIILTAYGPPGRVDEEEQKKAASPGENA